MPDLDDLKTDVATLKADVADLKDNVQYTRGQVDVLVQRTRASTPPRGVNAKVIGAILGGVVTAAFGAWGAIQGLQ